jgi:hypothetical protein
MMLVPQKPYMVLGTLRQQLLYPVYDKAIIEESLQVFNQADQEAGILDFPIKASVQTKGEKLAVRGNGVREERDEKGHEGPSVQPPEDEKLVECLRLVRVITPNASHMGSTTGA